MISTLPSFWLRLLTRLALLLAFSAFAASAGAQTTITFFHNDILGSPAIATDADGAVVWKENYLPYGHRLQAPAAGANNKLWFAGKPYDQTNWITYMGARYYIPLIGRFTSVDPQGIVPENPHSFNRYAYANNNPYKYVDPDGRSATLALKVLVTAAVLVGAANHLTPEQRARMEQAGALLQQRTSELLDRASGLVFNEGADTSKGQVDTAVNGLTEGLKNETDAKGRPTKGQYVKPGGDAQKDLDSLPGTAGDNGQKILPDGSVAGIHTSTTTGLDTLHVHRPSGSRDIKIRYPQ